MAQTTLLINYDDVLHYSIVSGNIDQYKLSPVINSASILYMEPLLGSSLYDKIVSMVTDQSISGNTDYFKLYDEFIVPSLVYHTLENFISLNHYQVADGGTYTHQSTIANTSSRLDVDRVIQTYRTWSAKFDKKLQDYLCKNSNLYPEYTNNNGLVKKQENVMRSGIYVGIRNSPTSKIRI